MPKPSDLMGKSGAGGINPVGGARPAVKTGAADPQAHTPKHPDKQKPGKGFDKPTGGGGGGVGGTPTSVRPKV